MNTQISSLIEDQLPGFIVSDYENFQKVLESYYEHLESPGNPLDIITNLSSYNDIDYYEKYLLQERTTLSTSLNSSDTTIIVADASSFPQKNGYVRIDNEICFYKERTDTELLEVSRGVSGTTELGTLYSSSKFVSSESSSHSAGVNVDNLSHLFLYAIVKSFEQQYLQSFPESYLKGSIDKRTLIKNISNFYKVKGTDKSIRFIFNTIVSKSADDIPTTYNPKDQTLKASVSDWDSSYGIQAVVLAGDPNWLIGNRIVQQSDSNRSVDYASALVENFYSVGEIGGKQVLNLILNSASINSSFAVPEKTVLTRSIAPSLTTGDTITVDSTFGWKDQTGVIVINGEVIKYERKTSRQFYIKQRGTITRTHGVGDEVISYSTVKGVTPDGIVTLLVYGTLSNLSVENALPYSREGDRIQVSKPGFESSDPILYDSSSLSYRWKVNVNGEYPSVPLNPTVGLSLQKYLADIGAIYEDSELYYVATSTYPSTPILTANISKVLTDPKLLKIIPKSTTTTSEVYKTSRRDVGIFVDGTLAFGYKDEELIKYGQITKFNILNRGSGYRKDPFVLINGEPEKAYPVLSGDTVTDIISNTTENFVAPPTVEIVSGRNAVLQPIVTSGEITSIRIVDPGEYYSSPPAIVLGDISGKGRFAEYRAVVSTQGQITDLIKVDGGKFYTQETVTVSVIPDANSNPASATADIKEWVKNRYYANQSNLDTNGGLVISGFNGETNYYGVVSNPRNLRLRLSDNLTNTGLLETSAPKIHSPILGYAYDGNPIYGPYAYSDPLNPQSSIVRMQSGYSLKGSRTNGPIDAPYPMGTFVDDYQWTPTVDTGKTRLDVNNGRFCVTPDYPNGVYAYFLTIGVSGTPVFPYILGDNFYSLPVRSNYESDTNQESLPDNVKRLFIPGTTKNGSSEIAIIESVSKGSVSGVTVEDSQPIYSVGSRIYVNDSGSGGSGAGGVVSSTFGKPVLSIESQETKAYVLSTVQSFYSFAGDIVTQTSTGATGELLRDTIEENTIALRNVSDNFVAGEKIESSTTVLNLLLNQNSTYTKDATLYLVLFDDPTNVIASGIILSGTSNQNSVRIKVTSGDFGDYLNYPEGETILKSSDLSNTPGTEIIIINNLSKNIDVSTVNGNVAILETDGNHDFAEGDVVDIKIDPDESTTETTYYVSKKRYQEVDLIPRFYNGKINDTGIGTSTMVGLGRDYVGGTYQDVELIFSNYTNARDELGEIGDANNAKATVVVNTSNFDGSGQIESITITSGGSGYTSDDILTINPNSVPKVDPSDLDVSIDPEMVYLNQTTVDAYQIYYFTVNNFASAQAFLPAAGELFYDDDGYEYVLLEEDVANERFQYAPTTPYYITANTTLNFGTITITSIDSETPPGAPLPQYRFRVNGEENPEYRIRVGSTWTMDVIPEHQVYVVSNYTTNTADDGVALLIDEYTAADNVTNNGLFIGSTDPAESIVFTPTAPGTYYYVCIMHPEASGKIIVEPAPSTAIPLVAVNSVGLGAQRSEIIVDKIFSLSEGDLLQVGSEIVRVTGIDGPSRRINLDRGINGTTVVDHLPSSAITSYKPKYNFVPGTQIFGTNVNDPYVVSYNETTHKLVINYDFAASNPRRITNVSSFFDHSVPQKVVVVSSTQEPVDRLQFSLDNVSFLTNPIVDIQKYYFYKFDTSHPSMSGSYLDVSTSANYNVFTEEKEVGLTEPGNPGSFVRIRLGYGANIGDVKRKEVNYTTYYYFLTSSETDTGGSYLRVKDDPLTGLKNIVYTTENKFVYSIDDVPQYDGSGDTRYTGKSVGKIASISLDNLGENYESLPIIEGVVPAVGYRAEVSAVRNASSGSIQEIKINYAGKNYSKPKAVLKSGDGSGLKLEVQSDAGIITAVKIINPGTGYTYTPSIDIIETNNKLFFTSSNIGVPTSVRFINYGSTYFNDNSIISTYNSPKSFIVSNFDLNAFADGERVEQKINGVVTAFGRVASGGWSRGTNVLRLVDINGVFRSGYGIIGVAKSKTAVIVDVLESSFKPDVYTLTRTIGKFNSDRGKLSSLNQRITDSNFYQDYSYVIRSRTPINEWRNVVKDTTHPAGFKMFGEVYLESESSVSMNQDQPVSQKLTSFVILPSTAVSSLTTRRSIKTSIVKVKDSRVVRGKGSASVNSFDETLTRVREIELSPAFDGRYDPSTGLKIGNRTFTMIDKLSGTAFAPYNEQAILVTIDGVAQNPGYSYVVSGNQITFYEAPLGKRQEIVDGNIIDVPGQNVYIRGFSFRESADNARYLRKLRDIHNNFDGRTRIFDLFYEDGSIVKSEQSENFMIYLNAVLQQGSYEIRRFASPTKTDQIVFSKAPKNYNDLYDGTLPDQLQNEEYFFGFGVGSYQRLGINEKLIPYSTKTNQYQIIDENGRVKNFDTPLYAYVYIDGVLQKDGISYRISGPSITFNRPLTYALQGDGSYTTARVDILYFYGKDYAPTVTLFDFEDDTFFNRAKVSFYGTGTEQQFSSWYKLNTTNKTIAYQIVNGVHRVWGEVIRSSAGTPWSIDFRAQNLDMVDGEPVYFSRKGVSNIADTITVSFDSFTVDYLSSDQNERILNRVDSNYIPFLNTDDLLDSFDYKGDVIKEHPNLRVGDLIQIDGETESREVFSIPLYAKTKEYRPGEQVSNSYFTKINVGSYNKDFFGEGLSVTAKLENGVVTSLNWNKRDLQQYFDNGILLNPTAYQYYTPPVLNFIPVDGQGGGAKAEVVVYGGQIIDLVLIDGGSGYTKAPRVVTSRGYNILRENNYPESSFVIDLQSKADTILQTTIVSVITDIPKWKYNALESVTALVAPTPLNFKEILVCYITPEEQSVTIPGIVYPTYIIKQVQKHLANNSLTHAETVVKIDYELTENVSYVTHSQPVTKYYTSGILDMTQTPMGDTAYLYSQGTMGMSVGAFIEYLFMDVGYSDVSGISLEQLEYTYTQFKGISEGVDTWMENYAIRDTTVTSDGTIFNAGIPSIQELMSYLDAPLSDIGTVAYIPDTTNFPASGTILIGKELVSYTAKFSDRLIGLSRGVNGTTAESHLAGTLIRTIGLLTAS